MIWDMDRSVSGSLNRTKFVSANTKSYIIILLMHENFLRLAHMTNYISRS